MATFGQVHTISSLESAADAYIATPKDDPMSDQMWAYVMEWMTASFEADGYTDAQLEEMDIKSAAQEYVDRRQGRA